MKILLLSLAILSTVFYTCSSTTQNFTFQTFEFGNGGSSSYLNDVWIFDENNIWAVGDISLENGNGYTNIFRWNGKRWYPYFKEFDSGGFDGIWAADSNNIYFADGLLLKYQVGVYNYGVINYEDFSNISYTVGQGVHKLWGSSESNIWGVGPWGTIVHYDGSQWTKIDFDTKWRFDAVTGSEKTGIAYASATDQSFNTAIVELKDNSANIIYNSANTTEHLTSFSIKLLNENELLLGNTKVWKFNISAGQTELQYTLTSGYAVVDIAIYSPIDIYYFIDQYGPGEELLHYNGKRFKEINFSSRNSVIYGGAYAIKDLAILTGFSNNKAYLVEVKRR